MTPEAMKLGSDGTRSGSPGCWIPKLRLFLPTPPMWRGTLPCCPPQRSYLPWFSSPSFLVFIRDRRLKSCAPHPQALCYLLASGTKGIPGPSQFSPGSCVHPSSPKPGMVASPGPIAVQGSSWPLPQEADPNYPMGMVIQLHPLVPS